MPSQATPCPAWPRLAAPNDPVVVSPATLTLMSENATHARYKVEPGTFSGDYEQIVTVVELDGVDVTDQLEVVDLGGGGEPTAPTAFSPDVVVSTPAAVRSTVLAWEADWAGTVPVGKTESDPRIVGLDVSPGGTTIDLSGIVVPQRVYVRPAGATYSDRLQAGMRISECSIDWASNIDLSDSTNVWILLAQVTGGGTRIDATGSSGCGVERCVLQGRSIPADPAATDYDTGAANYVVDVIGPVSDFSIRNSLVRYGENGVYIHSGTNDGYRFEGVVFDWTSHDDIKNTSNLSGLEIVDVWFTRRIRASVGSDFHEDCLHHHGGGLDGGLIRGTFMLLNPAMWSGGSAGSRQGLFFGDTGNTATNLVIEQNVLASNNGVVKRDPEVLDTGSVSRDNLAVHIGSGSVPASINVGDRLRNWTMTITAGDNGAGTDGVAVDVGDWASKDLTEADEYFANGCPTAPSNLGDYMPAPGSRLHWDHPNPVGAAQRLREIFVEGRHPGNVGWPVAASWWEQYNSDGAVASLYSPGATYDADGNIEV